MPANFDSENRQTVYGSEQNRPDYASGLGVPGITRRRCGSAGSRLFVAIFLVVAGTLLFLDNIGVLRVHNIWDYWPLILVAAGVGKLSGCRYTSERLLGVFLILFGLLFLLLSLHVLTVHSWDHSWPFSLLLIALGFVTLIKVVESGRTGSPRLGFPAQFSASPNDVLNETSVAGNVKRRLDTANFAGGQIDCFFASVEIDLRHAQISSKDKPVRIDVNCFCGAAKLRIPDTWIVSLQAPAILGNVEDKTIPPRTTGGIQSPTLVITGQSLFGAIEVEN